METSLTTLRKKGNPYLFDALHAGLKEVLLPLMPGTRKTAVVVIGDGLDRGSKSHFSDVLSELQGENVTVYSLQIPDRTGGCLSPRSAEGIFRHNRSGRGNRRAGVPVRRTTKGSKSHLRRTAKE
jgi:hypothetical protein